MINILGFLPDVDPTTPGAIKDCNNIVPTIKGVKAAPTTLDAGVTAASAVTNSLFCTKKLDDSNRTFVGTDETLEESSGGAWVDRSRVAAYNCGTDYRWSFAQFGNVTLAANRGDVIQASPTDDFDDITGSPKARFIAVNEGFVMAVNLDTDEDGWICSGYQDYTDWNESLSTQSTSGRVIAGGQFTGLKQFGSGFVAWKKNAMYIASYVGVPVVFQWNEIPGDVGCETSHAAVDIGDRIAFQGSDDFYIFDGANNVPIGQGIREWFFETADTYKLHRTIATYNAITGNITWHFVSNASTDDNPDLAVVYNVRSNKWGKYALTIECAATNYISTGITYNGFGTEYLTWDDGPNIAYDSPYWTAGVALSGVMLTDHILYSLTGSPSNSTFTLNSIGEDELFTTITRVRPRFLTAPISSNVDYSYDDLYGDQFTSFNSYDLDEGKYDLLHSSRWHEVKYNFVGNMEIIGVNISLEMDGTE